MQEYDACVIGAGYAGAPVAALLAKSSSGVALIEKTARAGGKTQSTERNGYRLETFWTLRDKLNRLPRSLSPVLCIVHGSCCLYLVAR